MKRSTDHGRHYGACFLAFTLGISITLVLLVAVKLLTSLLLL